MRVTRIMVPLDGSHLAEAVLPMAVTLAECLGAGLTLLHIVEENAPTRVHGDQHLRTAEEAESYLQGLARRYGDRVNIEMHVHGTGENKVALSIADHAAELGADMIAVCTHGRSGFRRVVWGSIAQQVLKRVRVPVLIVQPGVPFDENVRHLLVPLDGTPRAEAALDVAVTLAEACGSEIHVINVVPTVETVTGERSAAAKLTPLSMAEVLNAENTAARLYMAGVQADLLDKGLQAETEVKRGEVVPNIAKAAADVNADIIIVATHGTYGLDAMYAGSIGQSIISLAGRPVLLVKMPKR